MNYQEFTEAMNAASPEFERARADAKREYQKAMDAAKAAMDAAKVAFERTMADLKKQEDAWVYASAKKASK